MSRINNENAKNICVNVMQVCPIYEEELKNLTVTGERIEPFKMGNGELIFTKD